VWDEYKQEHFDLRALLFVTINDWPNFKVPLFRCQWVKGTGGGVKVDKEYGMTTVDVNNTGYKDDPFVLAAEVNQVFYVKDMSTKPKRGKTMTNQSTSQSAT
jgi:hypothetical protein